MKIGLIGSGKMAQAMGGYLMDRGYPVCGIWGRDYEKSSKAAEYLHIQAYENFDDLVADSGILLLAVSDDALVSVSTVLADCGVPLTGKWVGHFSGSLSLDILEPVALRKAAVFSLHPLQTVPAADRGRKDLSRATFVLEAAEILKEPLQNWLRPSGNPLSWLIPEKKALYHLGACLASNYVMTLYGLAEEALIDSGMDRETASKALIPLMESTLNNYRTLGASEGLTGPVSRGDVGTVRMHLDSLNTPEWASRTPLVKALGREALKMARESTSISDEKGHLMDQILIGGNAE